MKKFSMNAHHLTGLAAIVVFMGMCIPAGAQSYTFTEWATPTASSLPLHVIPVSSTEFYFTENAKNRIGAVNISSNTVTEWVLPAASMPHSITLDASGNIVFAAYSGNYVGVYNPNATTLQLTKYPIPTAGGGIIHLDTQLSPENAPEYFFSEATANKMGLLDPNAVGGPSATEWNIPTASSTPRGVSIGGADGTGTQVFFAELNTHRIGMLDTFTNDITEWTIPSVRQVEHLHYVNGLVYFGDLATSVVGILNPVTNEVKEWQAPTTTADVPDVFVVGTNFYFSERAGTKIGFLNTTAQTPWKDVILKGASVVVTPETPTTTAVTATPVTLTPKTTPVQPTITQVSGVANGGFTEWTVPTSASGPLGINGVGSMVVFAEYYGSKVATVVPTASPIKPTAAPDGQ